MFCDLCIEICFTFDFYDLINWDISFFFLNTKIDTLKNVK